MSMAERFPELDLHLPDWLLNAPDDKFDAVELARRASLEDLRSLDPMARLVSAVDLHLSAPAFASGAINSEAAELFGLFQSEVHAASDSGDERWTTLQLVGSSPGSVVLHLAPAEPEDDAGSEPSLAIPVERAFDSALRRVLDLHDRFENEQAIDTKAVKRPLREAARRFVEALVEMEASLDIEVYSAQGRRRRSRLGSQGLRFAARQFELVEHAGVEIVFGELRSVSVDGRIVLYGSGAPRRTPDKTKASGAPKRRRARNYEIRGVPVEFIRSGRLLPGQSYGIQVIDRTTTDSMKTKRRDDFVFEGLASLDQGDGSTEGEHNEDQGDDHEGA